MNNGEFAEIMVLKFIKEQYKLNPEPTAYQHPVDVLVPELQLAIEVRDISGKGRKVIKTNRRQRLYKNAWAKGNDYTLITIVWDNGHSRWKQGFRSFSYQQMHPMKDLDLFIRHLRRTGYENR